MPGDVHEIRDPIHIFVRLDSDERRVLDSAPFQRLRHIHQLALTYLVYPGATHKRFEHSLGVMELAGRVFDIVTQPNSLTDEIRDLLTPLTLKSPRLFATPCGTTERLAHMLTGSCGASTTGVYMSGTP